MSSKEKRTKAKAVAISDKGIIIFVLALLFCLVGLMVGKHLLLTKRGVVKRGVTAERSHIDYDYLRKSYAPFCVQHINPQYLFSFPFDLEKRRKLNNEVCSVDDNGFRGLGPEYAGSRKLAFVLGGSAAFGHFATSDYTTITGCLNTIQKEYFFVNAGVPSWNSTQELHRLIYQILEYEPALVIAYDGANDIAIMLDYYQKGLLYPPGTPESFDDLYTLVDNIRAGKRKPSTIMPSYIRKNKQARAVEPVLTDLVESHGKKYVYNLKIMNTVASAQGTRFIGIFQPIIRLHKNIPAEKLRSYKFEKQYKQFHKLVFEKNEGSFEHLDFSNVFDSYYEQIPCRNGKDDISGEPVFVDHVHLSDVGNKIIAREIHKYLRGER